MLQAKLLQVEAERNCEATEKEAALKRVAELEASNAELSMLEEELAKLAKELELAGEVQQAQKQETQELQQQAKDLEARNSEFSASISAAADEEAKLKVGAPPDARQLSDEASV